MFDTRCIRCKSPNTKHWRVDEYGFVKFYCEVDWLLYNTVDKPLIEKVNRFLRYH